MYIFFIRVEPHHDHLARGEGNLNRRRTSLPRRTDNARDVGLRDGGRTIGHPEP
jgi:hypothetical protein